MELFKRLRNRDIRYQDMKKTNETSESPESSHMETENVNEETDKMSVNEIRLQSKKKKKKMIKKLKNI